MLAVEGRPLLPFGVCSRFVGPVSPCGAYIAGGRMSCVAFGDLFCARVLNPSKRRVVVALRLSLGMAPNVAVRCRAVACGPWSNIAKWHVQCTWGDASEEGDDCVLEEVGGEKNVVKSEERGKNKQTCSLLSTIVRLKQTTGVKDEISKPVRITGGGEGGG